MKLFTKLDAAGAELPDDSTDHVVLIDHTLNLMIDVRDELVAKHRDAPEKVAALDLLGHKDWRLQTPRELFSQLRHDATPYYDAALYPNTKTEYIYWTGQVDPEYSDLAFAVNFNNGNALWYGRDSHGVVRAVRELAPGGHLHRLRQDTQDGNRSDCEAIPMTAEKYHPLTAAIIVKPITESILSEMATTVSMVDEGAGPFVQVEQHGRTDIGKIMIDAEEWPSLREAIERMFKACEEAGE